MSLVNRINKLVNKKDEAMHQNTKVRQLEGAGSRKARLTVKEAMRMVEQMLEPDNDEPNPKTETDKVLLQESMHMMDMTMKKLKAVNETKKKLKSMGN